MLRGNDKGADMKNHHQIQADEANITAVIFAMGTYFDGVEKIAVENKYGCFTGVYYPAYSSDKPESAIKLTDVQYRKYLHDIYMAQIKEWDENYEDPCVLDGTSWELTIRYSNGTERQWSGCNAYPLSWNRFIKAVNSLDLPDIK